MKTLLSVVLISVSLLGGARSAAAPYLPRDDDEILERLPKSAAPAAGELRELRDLLAQRPDDLPLAVRLARRYIELGRVEADPRYFGYAQGALKTWWDQAEPPVEVLVLRATVRQNRHEFEAALDDLDETLIKDPGNAQAWLTRTVIFWVKGRYAEALQSCLPLLNLVDPVVATACVAQSASLSGQAGKSYEVLRETLRSSRSANLEENRWALTMLAEMAARLGRLGEAEQHFRAALALGDPSPYLLGAYADLLLDQQRYREAAKLLEDRTRIDGLLLRLTLAERGLQSADFPRHRESLGARFAASRRRGDSLHQGDEARFMLHLLNRSREALRLAQANWAVQREPRDARILLEAALATGDAAAAEPVLEMLQATGLEDVRLRRLAARFAEDR